MTKLGSKCVSTVTVTDQVDNVFTGNSLCNEKCDFNAKTADSKVNTLNTGDYGRVYSRVFYNSMVRKQNVQGLFARGNKMKHMTTTWGRPNNDSKQQSVNVVSIQGMYDIILTVTSNNPMCIKNVQSCTQTSVNYCAKEGVKTTITSGQQ